MWFYIFLKNIFFIFLNHHNYYGFMRQLSTTFFKNLSTLGYLWKNSEFRLDHCNIHSLGYDKFSNEIILQI